MKAAIFLLLCCTLAMVHGLMRMHFIHRCYEPPFGNKDCMMKEYSAKHLSPAPESFSIRYYYDRSKRKCMAGIRYGRKCHFWGNSFRSMQECKKNVTVKFNRKL